MVTDGTSTCHGDCFVMYRNIKSLYCAPGSNSVIGLLQLKKTTTGSVKINQSKKRNLNLRSQKASWRKGGLS